MVRSPGPLGIVALAVVVLSALEAPAARAYVGLMAGQSAQPLRGSFNNVPVLHSNQPEEVTGLGILINTAPGQAMAVETGQWLRNAEFTFDGEFGLHLHHKYFPPSRGATGPDGRRPELTIATVLINPGVRPVHIRFETGAVRNSFEAPYLANNLMGVKPLGPRPWNTGPGDATAVQMLRGRLDPRLSEEITIPPRSRLVLFTTRLPALGIANALLRGHSDGPFQMAVVAAKRAGMKIGFYVHAAAYVAVNIGLYLLSASQGKGWAIYPALGWGLGLLLHGAVTWLAMPGSSWRERMVARERRLLGQQRP